MSKVRMIDHFSGETIDYDSSELQFLKITSMKRYDHMVDVVLENGVLISYQEDFDVYSDHKRIVYAPVYEVQICDGEEECIDEKEGMIGFVNREYDYADSLN